VPATPDNYIACRTYGHAWFDAPIEGAWAQGWGSIGGNPMCLKCERCTAERHDVVNSLGEIIYRRYLHPENYKYQRNERPTIQDMRLALIAVIRQNRRDDLAQKRAVKRANGA
jgi:hypothetical protein